MQKIIDDFKKFIDLCSTNFWSSEDGLSDNFRIYVDKPENNLDNYLNCDYQGTPFWFYFLSFDYSFFDYFKERIQLRTDWDYTLLFNVDYIECSSYFLSLSNLILNEKLTPFCPSDVLLNILKKEDFDCSSFNFQFPLESSLKLSNKISSDFFKHAKIQFQLSSFSYILDNHFTVGIEILHFIISDNFYKKIILSQLSNAKNNDFFNVKINIFFHYPEHCLDSFLEKIDSKQLSLLVTEIISEKKIVDKKNLFKIMSKEHLILAICTNYFSVQELSQFITDKNIHYHLLDLKLLPHKKLFIKNNKI